MKISLAQFVVLHLSASESKSKRLRGTQCYIKAW